jgi:hypothetical protein
MASLKMEGGSGKEAGSTRAGRTQDGVELSEVGDGPPGT